MLLRNKITNEDQDIEERYPSCWVNKLEHSVNITDFETPTQRLTRLCKTSSKVVISKPTKGVTVDVLQTNSYLIVYSHTRGNHWNISGNHYKYYHDINTGEYIPEHLCKQEKTILKSRLLMADFRAIKQNHCPVS